MLTSEGELHRRQRRLLQPLFAHRQIGTYGAATVAAAERLASRWPAGGRLGQDGQRPGRDDPGAAGCSIDGDQRSHSGINALRSLLVTEPPELRDELRALSTSRLVGKAAQFRPGAQVSPLAASKLALRHLARRCQLLEAE